MSDDLLFYILPRQGKVPVKADDTIKQVSKESRMKGLSEEEKEEHEDERQVSKKEQYKRIHHQDSYGHDRNSHQQHEPDTQMKSETKSESAEDAKAESEPTQDSSPFKHLDIYI